MTTQSETVTLDEIQLEFKEKVGHLPHNMQQLLQYCKQNNLPFKYREIKSWWQNRPNPTYKPVEVPVNATVDLMDIYSVIELICYGYIRLYILPLLRLNTIIPIDIINTIYEFYEINKFKSIFIARKDTFDPFYLCINLNNDVIKMCKSFKSKQYGDDDLTWKYRGYCNANNIHLLYPSIVQSLINKKYIAASTYVGLNGIFGSSTCAIYESKYYHNALFNDTNTLKSIELYPFDLPKAPGHDIRNAIYDNKHGFIIAADNSKWTANPTQYNWNYRRGFNYSRQKTEVIEEQTYYELIEINNELKWNQIKNEFGFKGYSNILMINNSTDLLVVDYSYNSAIYNFKSKKWMKLTTFSYKDNKPINLCYDENNKFVYCYHYNHDNIVDIHYFDLLHKNKWNQHSILKLNTSIGKKIFMWIEIDGSLYIHLNDSIYKKDSGKIYQFNTMEKQWIYNPDKTKIFSEYKEIEYMFT